MHITTTNIYLNKKFLTMASLSLVADYSSSEDDSIAPSMSDEFPLPKRPRLPPPSLPTLELSKSITSEPLNDPSLHGNRKRSFPHEPGNWATHIGISIPSSPELTSFVESLQQTLNKLDLQPIEDLHISLSRVLVLRHHWIKDFVSSLRQAVSVSPGFSLILQGLSVYSNDEKTRTFLALKVTNGAEYLKTLVTSINKCLLEYRLPKFYDQESFHVSLLWCLGDVTDKLKNELKIISNELQNYVVSSNVECCFCKTGNKTFNLTFS